MLFSKPKGIQVEQGLSRRGGRGYMTEALQRATSGVNSASIVQNEDAGLLPLLVGNGGMGYNYNYYYYHSSIPY